MVSRQTGLSDPCVLLCNDDTSGCVTLAVAMVNDGNCNYGEIPSNMIPNNGVYPLRVFTRATLSASDLNPPKKLKSVESDVLWCTATVRQQDDSPIITRLLDNLYIHSDYAPVINCVTDYDNCDPYLLNDPHQCTQYVVGTTYQQMLIFDNGKVLHHTSLECIPLNILVCQVCPVRLHKIL